MLRPPKQGGQEVWVKTSAELREAATKVAHAAATRDPATSQARLVDLANVCNKCHQTFRVATRLTPFQDEKK
jgi:cytochrome c556